MNSLVDRFKGIDTSDLPDFYSLTSTLDMALWVLLVAKDKLNIEQLLSEDISDVLVHVMEKSVTPQAITNAFNRGGYKVHVIYKEEKAHYKIMKDGRNYLCRNEKNSALCLHYFEPGKPFYSKSILREKVFPLLKGPLKIVDPYCSVRTLDIIKSGNSQKIQLLTRLSNLNDKKKEAEFARELAEFKVEYKDVEVRNWTHTELHDRYILSDSSFLILGHSIKDIGTKESFGVLFQKQHYETIFDDMQSAFNRRWKNANPL